MVETLNKEMAKKAAYIKELEAAVAKVCSAVPIVPVPSPVFLCSLSSHGK